MLWHGLALSLVVLVTVAAFDASAAAQYPPARAELVVPRDGLGNVLAKLKAGGDVRIAYFGGSITAAAGWRVKTLAWFRSTWPGAKPGEINAAIGGTGSDLGAFRCRRDVVDRKPDLVFVEFAVNDGGGAPARIHATMEGIVRQIWRADPRTDICFVYTFRTGYEKELDQGLCPNALSAHERVAAHYGIPSINVALRTTELQRAGSLVYVLPQGQKPADGVTLFSNDGVHPLDAAHEIYTKVIAEAIESMAKTSRPGAHRLREAYEADNWEDAQLAEIAPSMLTGSWAKLGTDKGLGKSFADRLPSIWHSSTPGDSIAFKFKGSACQLYDLLGPDGGKAMVTLDDKPPAARDRFDSYCTYHRLASLHVAADLPKTVHTVRITISPDQPNRESVLKNERSKPGFAPAKYDGTNLWLGYIMLRGQIVE